MFAQGATDQRRLAAGDKSDTRIGPEGTDGWVTLNIRGQGRVGPVTADVMLENISDKAYKTHGSGVYAPGRNFILRLTYPGN